MVKLTKGAPSASLEGGNSRCCDRKLIFAALKKRTAANIIRWLETLGAIWGAQRYSIEYSISPSSIERTKHKYRLWNSCKRMTCSITLCKIAKIFGSGKAELKWKPKVRTAPSGLWLKLTKLICKKRLLRIFLTVPFLSLSVTSCWSKSTTLEVIIFGPS